MAGMNRKQRRYLNSLPAHKRQGFYNVSVSPDAGIKDGEKLTISGHRRNKDGSIETNCKRGRETVFIAKVQVNG